MDLVIECCGATCYLLQAQLFVTLYIGLCLYVNAMLIDFKVIMDRLKSDGVEIDTESTLFEAIRFHNDILE